MKKNTSDSFVREQEKSNLVRSELTENILFAYLSGEIALQRGQVGTALSAYRQLIARTDNPRIAHRATEIAARAGQIREALEFARRWYRSEGGHSQDARKGLLTLLAANLLFEELEKVSAEVLASANKQERGEILLGLARTLGSIPKKEETAYYLLYSISQPYPRLPETHFVRALAASRIQKKSEALSAIERALQLRSDWEQAALLRASLTEDPSQKMRQYQEFLDDNPGATNLRTQYAQALLAENHLDEAREQFEALLQVNKSDPGVIYAIAILSLQLGDSEKAEQRLRDLMVMTPEHASIARFYLAQLADKKGKVSEAIARYQSIPPGEFYTRATIRLAQLLVGQNQLDKARSILSSARRSDSENSSDYLFAEARILEEAGQHQQSFNLLKKALRKNPHNTELLYQLGISAVKVKQWRQSETYLRRLIMLDPDNAHAYNALGYTMADRNHRLNEAERLINKAIELKPNDPAILDSLAWLYYRQGKYEEALEILGKVIGTVWDVEFAAHYGEILWVSGQQKKATKIWEKAREEDGSNELLLETLKRFGQP